MVQPADPETRNPSLNYLTGCLIVVDTFRKSSPRRRSHRKSSRANSWRAARRTGVRGSPRGYGHDPDFAACGRLLAFAARMEIMRSWLTVGKDTDQSHCFPRAR